MAAKLRPREILPRFVSTSIGREPEARGRHFSGLLGRTIPKEGTQEANLGTCRAYSSYAGPRRSRETFDTRRPATTTQNTASVMRRLLSSGHAVQPCISDFQIGTLTV